MTTKPNDGSEVQGLFFNPMEVGASPGKLIFRIEVPGRLPSWNDILGMEEWARYQYKKQVAEDFMSVLRQSAQGSLTRTICVKSSLSICVATLESYQAMRREKRKLRSAKKKRSLAEKSLFELKSSSPEVPF